MNLQDFFYNIFLQKKTVKELLDLSKSPSERGFIFERCGDLLIKLGFLSKFFDNSKYAHIIGNIGEGSDEKLYNIKDYIQKEKVNSGNKNGVSDITLFNIETKKYIFISSKFYQDKKNVNDYDVQDIVANAVNYDYIYKSYDIYLLVRNKNEVLKIIKNSNKSSEYLTNHMLEDKIIDIDDLEISFTSMKNYIEIYGVESIFDNFNFKKQLLIPKFHQKLIEIKIFNKINLSENFLLGLKSRSGKTYLVAFIICNTILKKDKFNILIITPSPRETMSQFLEIFRNYTNFNDFNIIQLDSGSVIKDIKLTHKNIIVTSKQLLENYINEDKIKIFDSDFEFDYLFFDENHYGGTTSLSKEIINNYTSKNTKLFFLTATFHKTLNTWNIPSDCCFYWNLEDEELCKKKDINSLVEKHGCEVNQALNYFNDSNILLEYQKMPNLELITTMFDNKVFNNLKEKLENNNKYGFSLKTLFSIVNGNFKYNSQIELLLSYISGSDNINIFPYGENDKRKSIFSRIIDISTAKNNRTLLCNNNFTTQLWFLPFGIDQKINDVSQNLKKLMLNDKVLKKYEILILNNNIERPIKDIKKEIKKQELYGKENNKKGLIILAGNQCSLGISLENCDVVLLLNDIVSSDKIYQMMFRCMTEAPNKKCGFVVDFNTNRVLSTIIDYVSYKKNLSNENKIKYIVENNLINIDSDYLINKEIDSCKIINKLLDVWKQDPANSLKKLIKSIEDEILNIDNEDQKEMNNRFTKSVEKNNNQKILLNDNCDNDCDNDGNLPSGTKINKIVIDDNNDDDDDEGNESDVNEKKTKISFTKDVLPSIIPISSILTINDNNKNLLDMLYLIKENEELLEIFNDQTFIWWKENNIIDLIKYLIKKYIKEDSDIFNITIYIKMNLQSLIDKPDELLSFINDNLKPKLIEKKTYGEVFSPMFLVNQMLDKLPDEVWTNPNYRWLDPANGMGNFMIAIYFRLMKGLKNTFSDNDDEIKKHILENMLYMSEINKKNCFICKQIFDINNKYNLNIYNGDSLELDTKKVWDIEKFDIIVSNPPYNMPGIKATGNTIWYLFLSKFLDLVDKNKYFLFIHPSGWRKPESEKSKYKNLFKKMTQENQMLYLEIHNTKDGMKTFNCGTRYDWYLIHKIPSYKKTIIKDEKGVIYDIDLSKWYFLPNYLFNDIDKIISIDKNDNNIIFNRTNYGTDSKHVYSVKDDVYKYTLIHSTNKDGVRYYYSSKNDNGHFGIKKVIFGESGINNAIIDDKGIYGMTQGCMAIPFNNINEAYNIKKALESPFFKNILKSCSWSNFRIDWRLFTYFKKDFYEYILNNNVEVEVEVEVENDVDNVSLVSKSSDVVTSNLCGSPLKKKGEKCKNKPHPDCNGKCKKHYI